MRIFLDTSVMLAASGSATGASREVFRLAPFNNWDLIATPYAIEEVFRNLPALPPSAGADWMRLRASLLIMDDVLTLDRPAVFEVAKDRPILFGALAWAEVLLTLDRNDFGKLIGLPSTACQFSRRAHFLSSNGRQARYKWHSD